jgi:hypothetical protein
LSSFSEKAILNSKIPFFFLVLGYNKSEHLAQGMLNGNCTVILRSGNREYLQIFNTKTPRDKKAMKFIEIWCSPSYLIADPLLQFLLCLNLLKVYVV